MSIFLLSHIYFFLIPIAVLEGPILAFLCGVASAFGYVDPFIAWGILVVGDVIPDTFYYWIGRLGGAMPSVRRFIARTKLIREHLPELEILWREHFLPSLALAKLSYGVAPPLIVTIGIVGISYKRFVMRSFSIGFVYLGCLLWIGYGIAQTSGYTRGALNNAPYFFGIFGGLFLILFVGTAYWARKHLLPPPKQLPEHNVNHANS